MTIGSGSGARVAFLVFEKDGSDVVDSDVNGVGNTGDGEDALEKVS